MKKFLLLMVIAFISIIDQAVACTNWYTDPSVQDVLYDGGTDYYVTVYATGTCTMNAKSSDSWINNITASDGGYYYNVDANYSCTSRTGYIDIYDASSNILETTLTITQDGNYNICSDWYVSPTSGYYTSSSNSDYFNVNATESDGPCDFYPAASDSWITAFDTVVGQVNFIIDANTDCASRVGYINIYVTCTNSLVATFTINQDGFSDTDPVGGTASADPSTVCSDGSSTLTLSEYSGCLIQWQSSPDNYNWTNIDGATDITYNIPSVISNTYYMAIVTNPGYSSTYSSSTLVSVINAPTISNTISKKEVILTSSAATGNQWYLNENIIQNATNQSYTATQTGLYSVEVTNNGCSLMSAETSVSVGIEEYDLLSYINIYPNPTNDNITIENKNQNISYNLEILNTLGQVVFNKKITNQVEEVELSDQEAGIYFVKLQSENNTIIKKIIKL